MNTTSIIRRAGNCLRERRLPDVLRGRMEQIREQHAPAYYRWRQRLQMRRHAAAPAQADLRRICDTALETGRQISMEGIIYGPAHWEKTGVLNLAPAYYQFLAGFIRSQGLQTIVEVGTWYGGSTLAMHRGLAGPGRIVTIDIDLYNPDGLVAYSNIHRLRGDAAADSVLNNVARAVDGQPVDLLYLDGDHRYESNRDILVQYGRQFQPRWIILDDIHWQWSMEKLWARLLSRHGARALDAGTALGFRTGSAGQGFGVVDCRRRVARWI